MTRPATAPDAPKAAPRRAPHRTLPRLAPLAPLALLAALLVQTALPGQARAQARDDMNVCLCRGVLARTLCKDPDEFSFIDEFRDSATYSFSVFYANKETRFLCMVTPTEVRIKGRAWQKILRTVPYELDQETLCGVTDYETVDCPRQTPLFCCGEKTDMEVSDDKAYEFWSRPIPEILEDELMREPQPQQEGQSEQ